MNYILNTSSSGNPSVDKLKQSIANMRNNSASAISQNIDNVSNIKLDGRKIWQDEVNRFTSGRSVVDKIVPGYDAYITDALEKSFNMGQKMTNPIDTTKENVSSYAEELDKALSGALRDENNQLFKDYFDAQIYHQIQGAEKAMQFEADQAKISRDWSEMMSNTAYQRAVADMKKAGLNPMLLVAKGFSPATTPNSASAKGFNVSSVSSDVDTNSYAHQTISKVLNSASEMLGTIGKVVQLILKK